MRKIASDLQRNNSLVEVRFFASHLPGWPLHPFPSPTKIPKWLSRTRVRKLRADLPGDVTESNRPPGGEGRKRAREAGGSPGNGRGLPRFAARSARSARSARYPGFPASVPAIACARRMTGAAPDLQPGQLLQRGRDPREMGHVLSVPVALPPPQRAGLDALVIAQAQGRLARSLVIG